MLLTYKPTSTPALIPLLTSPLEGGGTQETPSLSRVGYRGSPPPPGGGLGWGSPRVYLPESR